MKAWVVRVFTWIEDVVYIGTPWRRKAEKAPRPLVNA